jgi:rhamnosyltransferase subunit B
MTPSLDSAVRPKVLLATFGTLGDLHPFIAVALALKRRGVVPIIAAAPDYRAKIEVEGIRFQPMRPDMQAMTQRLQMPERALARAAAKRPDFIVRELVLPHLQEAYDDIAAIAREVDLIVTHSIAYAAQLAAEAWRIPRLSVALQPMIFFSAYDPPWLAQAPG